MLDYSIFLAILESILELVFVISDSPINPTAYYANLS